MFCSIRVLNLMANQCNWLQMKVTSQKKWRYGNNCICSNWRRSIVLHNGAFWNCDWGSAWTITNLTKKLSTTTVNRLASLIKTLIIELLNVFLYGYFPIFSAIYQPLPIAVQSTDFRFPNSNLSTSIPHYFYYYSKSDEFES